MNTSIEIEDTYPEGEDEDQESSEASSDDDFMPLSHSKKPRVTKEFKVKQQQNFNSATQTFTPCRKL